MNTTYRLVRLLSLPKLGEIGPVKLYPVRFLLSIKTQWPTFDVRLHNIQPLIIEEAHEVQSIGSRKGFELCPSSELLWMIMTSFGVNTFLFLILIQ